jgi:hypothetical protein
MGKVIEFPKNKTSNKLKTLGEVESLKCQIPTESNETQNIIDVTHILRERGALDRRKAQRVVFGHLIASYVVLPNLGLAQVVIRDIDEGGLAFEMDSFFGCFQKGDQVELRFYLNGQSYFRVNVIVAYSAQDNDYGVSRHGVQLIPDSLNQEALHHFIQFLKTVSILLKTDRGERVVSNLTS